MKGGLGNLMKQAQQMQKNMEKAQAELADVEVTGQAGSGAVKVVMTCAHEVRSIQLDDDLMDDKEMLEDLIQIAVNDAAKQAEATTQERMSAFSSGMGMPPGMKLPF